MARIICCASDDIPPPPDLDLQPVRSRKLSLVFRFSSANSENLAMLRSINSTRSGTKDSRTSDLLSIREDEEETTPLHSDSETPRFQGDIEDDIDPIEVGNKLRYEI